MKNKQKNLKTKKKNKTERANLKTNNCCANCNFHAFVCIPKVPVSVSSAPRLLHRLLIPSRHRRRPRRDVNTSSSSSSSRRAAANLILDFVLLGNWCCQKISSSCAQMKLKLRKQQYRTYAGTHTYIYMPHTYTYMC